MAATAAPNDAPSAAGAEGAPLPDASLAASVFPPQPRIPAASADVAAIARITAAAGLADGDADGGGRGLALAVAAGPVALSGSCHVAPARGAARRAQLPSDELYYIRCGWGGTGGVGSGDSGVLEAGFFPVTFHAPFVLTCC